MVQCWVRVREVVEWLGFGVAQCSWGGGDGVRVGIGGGLGFWVWLEVKEKPTRDNNCLWKHRNEMQ